MKQKCLDCKYGACLQAASDAQFFFKKVYKMKHGDIVEIDYNNGESGCRMKQWNDKEDVCLSNEFSEYEKFEPAQIKIEAVFNNL